ncbi:MAG: GNAT family N-acetyltransferase [Phycisphaeraceae bacterium]|nr:GNAT family N-acetyltransferase [Phycisphaeraceae bacterium]
MELTVAPQSYQPSDESLIRTLKAATLAMTRMVSQETELQGVIALDCANAPLIRQANRGADWDGTAESLARLNQHFADQHLQALVVDPLSISLTDAQQVDAQSQGYRADTRQVLVIKEFKPYQSMNQDLQVIPARAAYREVKAIYQRMVETDFGGSEALATQLSSIMADRLDEPRLDFFLGRMGGKSVALGGVYTQGQTGVIVPIYVDPQMRGKRLGLTLLDHILEHAQRAQFQQVILDRSVGCYAIPMYEKAGFVLGPTYMRLLKND